MKKSQNRISTLIAVAIALFLLVGVPMTAGAAAITGNILFGGAGMPVGSTTWFGATGVNFTNPWLVVGRTGDYMPIPFGADATFTNFNWGAGSGVVSVPMAQNIWTITEAGITYELNVGSVTDIDRGDALNDNIAVVGTGTLTITGFDPTPGTWSYTAGFTSEGVPNLSFSAGTGETKVPEPSALILLGSGLAALGFCQRRKR